MRALFNFLFHLPWARAVFLEMSLASDFRKPGISPSGDAEPKPLPKAFRSFVTERRVMNFTLVSQLPRNPHPQWSTIANGRVVYQDGSASQKAIDEF